MITLFLPKQNGHVGSSVKPIGGLEASSIELVYSTSAVNNTWQTSSYNKIIELICYRNYSLQARENILKISQTSNDEKSFPL